MEQAKVTPMMRQYLQIKGRYRDAILFFRLGDFYEMFFEDAEKASRILDIALTSRQRNEESAVPLCGVPYHAAEPYIRKLLEAGFKVAVCEQVEDPKLARGVVQREVVRVITPGTVTAAEALDARGNNFLVAVSKGRGGYGLAVADITTGEFRFTQTAEAESLWDEVGRIGPSEILLPEGDAALQQRMKRDFSTIHLSLLEEKFFSRRALNHPPGEGRWLDSVAGEWEEGIRAVCALVSYLEENAPESLKALREPEFYSIAKYLILDENTRKNLELVASLQGDRRGALLAILDRTVTPMGGRRLRQWLLYPLADEQAIRYRQEGVAELAENFQGRQELRTVLGKIQDLERLGGRIVVGTASPKDLVAVKNTLVGVRSLKHASDFLQSDILQSVREKHADLPEVVGLIERSIVDDPPPALKNGGFIREGFDPELDEVRGVRSHAKDWIAKFEAAERRRTGIPSLKVRYNRVFGYYIEVTRANLKAVPENYVRKQTLANGERYITPELKDYEAKVLNSEDVIARLEMSLLNRVREQTATHYEQMKETGAALATLDVLLALAEVAESCHFSRPIVDSGRGLAIREGRHPVVEAALGRGAFVPNDCDLDPDLRQIMLLTGPNMAGKSTYMRQVALIVILAQMGSWVPASEARIGLVDRVFTRIGASDSLARGESTFMVEMKETAHMLRYATERSLVLLDEVGRGTSTFDGISIAWAVAERLHDLSGRPRTLFATHYHELTDLARTRERIKNYNFAVKEWKGDVIFLRTLAEGAASRSYGIHVARLAGLPPPVVERAKEILANLERGEQCGRRGESVAAEQSQMALFESVERRLREELRDLEVSQLTPLDALNLLHRLSEEAKK